MPIALVMTLPLLCSCAGYRSTLAPRLSVGEEYTDNVNAAHLNKKSDEISTLTPGITYSMTGRTSSLSLSADTSLVYYAQTQGGSLGDTQSARLNAAYQPAVHSGLTLTDSFNRTDVPNPVAEPVFVRTNQPTAPIDYTIRTSKQIYVTNFANVGFRQEFGPGDYFLINYTSTLLNNEDPAYQDNTTDRPAVNLRYWFNHEYGIDLIADYTRGNFSAVQGVVYPTINETHFAVRGLRRVSRTLELFVQGSGINVDQAPIPGSQTYDVLAGFNYQLSPSTFLTLSGGYFFHNDDSGKQTSWYEAHADMAKRFRRASVRLTGDAGYDEAFFGAQNLGFNKFYGGAVAGRYAFTRHLSGIVSVGYRHSDYTDSDVTQSGTTFLAEMDYQAAAWMSFALRYTYNIADSTLADISYNENRVGVVMTLTPRTPYLLGR